MSETTTIIGIVVGVIGGVLLLSIPIYCAITRKNRKIAVIIKEAMSPVAYSPSGPDDTGPNRNSAPNSRQNSFMQNNVRRNSLRHAAVQRHPVGGIQLPPEKEAKLAVSNMRQASLNSMSTDFKHPHTRAGSFRGANINTGLTPRDESNPQMLLHCATPIISPTSNLLPMEADTFGHYGPPIDTIQENDELV